MAGRRKKIDDDASSIPSWVESSSITPSLKNVNVLIYFDILQSIVSATFIMAEVEASSLLSKACFVFFGGAVLNFCAKAALFGICGIPQGVFPPGEPPRRR